MKKLKFSIDRKTLSSILEIPEEFGDQLELVIKADYITPQATKTLEPPPDWPDSQPSSKSLRESILNQTRAFYRTHHSKSQDLPFIAGETKINYAGRVFDERELVNLVDSSLDFWLTQGRYCKEFEKRLAQYLDVRWAFLVNSGSSANLLAFMALTSPHLKERQVNRGDEVITIAAGFPTTVAPIVQYGAVPVFVDVNPDTANIDVEYLDAALSTKTKAVMLAHTLGNPFDLRTVKSFCERNSLWLIEDNCDALGSMYEDKLTGTWGDIGTSSFYPPHHMTLGEGGAVYTNNLALKQILISMRDWGRDCWCPSGKDNTCGKRFSQTHSELPHGFDHKYVYSHFGYNLKVTDMQAAIGCAQLEKLPSFTDSRRKNWKYLREHLAQFENIFSLPEPTAGSEPSWFGFLLRVKKNASFTRDEIVKHLEANQIQTRMLFAGNLINHPCFDELRSKDTGYRVVSSRDSNSAPLPHTDEIMKHSFWIGVYPGMTRLHLEYMVSTITRFVDEQ